MSRKTERWQVQLWAAKVPETRYFIEHRHRLQLTPGHYDRRYHVANLQVEWTYQRDPAGNYALLFVPLLRRETCAQQLTLQYDFVPLVANTPDQGRTGVQFTFDIVVSGPRTQIQYQGSSTTGRGQLSGQFGRDERSVAAELEVEHTGSTESTDQGVHEMATITRGYHIGAQGCQALGTRISECHFHQRRSDCRTLTNYANDIVLGQFRISALVDGEIQRYWIYTRGERRSLVLSS